MRLLTWNVQWCRGVDGVVDPARIAAFIRSRQVDVACLQEVAVHFPDLPGGADEDQLEALARALPGYGAFFVAAVDLPGANGRRSRFGNAILSRLPAGRVLRHSLPWPPSPDVASMPRAALEIVFDGLRVITTHLEYYSNSHRKAQVARLLELHEEALAERKASQDATYRAAARPASAIVCGDFNLPPDDPLHEEMLAGGFVDAWQALNPGKEHPPTFRLFEEGHAPYCCDFVFCTPDIALKSIAIDLQNQASDHQPVIVELA
ncbi:MAG TPA: endonuclease/exonuclease/phosphatase family protein [Burkholderiales bacterium]|nr:endonuclease/exonuclease/phosphatase family protein [Burkholderiales bacterium]